MVPFVTVEERLADKVRGDRVSLPIDERTHLRDVLRMEPGDDLELSDGEGWCVPALLAEDGATLTDQPVHSARPTPELIVVHALPKGRKLDEVIRLLTELGVERILPAESDHAVVKLDGQRAEKSRRRWQAVAGSAVNQSRRPWRCTVDPPRPLEAVLDDLSGHVGVVAHVGADRSVQEAVGSYGGGGPVILVVGPEGGWSDAEIAAFQKLGWELVRLGPTVLRTEHAAGVLTTLAAQVLGRLG